MPATLTPPPTPAAKQTEEEIAAELERLSRIGIETLNRRDWGYTSSEAQEFLSHIDPEHWQSKFDNQPGLLTWHEQNIVWRQLVEELHPDCHFAITHMSSAVHEKESMAIVWVQTKVTGIENVNIQGLSELRWRLENGKWWFFYHVGIRGFLGQSGFV
ncbi:uncharacterized protein RHO25_011140 [Cercospora beticola]|uniref:SnoaL-like domain-containing protein n=1 Tax=Cercospora beticola TaxID=122368 RepID=A0ABZ0P3Q3_CERBT|nr:hypothetical protein RHO25_011140 [Cercospora beticola]CAK1366388.1 unnamed protein product [Cercospora beticola]